MRYKLKHIGKHGPQYILTIERRSGVFKKKIETAHYIGGVRARGVSECGLMIYTWHTWPDLKHCDVETELWLTSFVNKGQRLGYYE